MEQNEIRSLDSEVRMLEDGSIEGLGIVFNSEARIGSFIETITPESVDDEMLQNDIRSFFNHDPNQILGRTTAGTLTLEKRADGIYYRIKNPGETEIGRRVAEIIKRGDVSGSSFQFAVNKTGEQWSTRADGTRQRTITKFSRISEIGPVVFPAYTDTTAAKRSLDEYDQEQAAQHEQEQRHDDPNDDLGYSYRERHLRLIRGK